jgi:hypothetical protein
MTDKRIASLMTDRQLQEVLGSVDTLYGACSEEIDRRGKRFINEHKQNSKGATGPSLRTPAERRERPEAL